MVTATRMSRFLAVLVDISPGLVIGVIGGIVAAVMMPGLFAGDFNPMAAASRRSACSSLVDQRRHHRLG